MRERYTAVADASAIVGSHATRHIGTIGGNVMNASPAMETGGPLICLGAVARLRSQSGERQVSVEELFTGPGKTSARPDELLTSIDLPATAPGTGSCYVRLEYRQQMEIAIVGATCLVVADGDSITDARVAITALAPTIRRVPEAEQALTGGDGSPDGRARGGRSGGGRLPADLGRPRLRPLPAGDGRRDGTARDQCRRRPRPRPGRADSRESRPPRRGRVERTRACDTPRT